MTTPIGSWSDWYSIGGLSKLKDTIVGRHKTSTMPKQKQNLLIKQSTLKELQDCAIAVGLDVVYGMDRMSNSAKKQALYDLVHGKPNDDDSMGLLEKLAGGVGEFACLFEAVDDDTGIPKLKIRDCLLKDPKSPPIVLKRDITLDLLKRKSKNSKMILSIRKLCSLGHRLC